MFVLGDGNPLVHIRAAYVNRSIIALCAVIYVLQVTGGVDWQLYAYVPASLTPGALTYGWVDTTGTPERLIAYQFLHVDFLHLAGNMLMLWVFGDNVEDALGHVRYLLFYLLCGIIGAVAFTFFVSDPLMPLLGASGSISGIMGAYLLLHPRARVLVTVIAKVPMALPAGLVVGFYVAINLIMAFDQISPAAAVSAQADVAWWAHVGGFGAGLALIPFARRKGVALLQPITAYPLDPFPRLREFASRFGLGGLFSGGHTQSPDNGLGAVLIRALVFLAAAGLMFGIF